MAVQKAAHSCDVCDRSFPSRADVRGNVSVYSDTGSWILNDVCDRCTGKVVQRLVEVFPKIDPLVYYREMRPFKCTTRECGQCAGCAADEDAAVEAA